MAFVRCSGGTKKKNYLIEDGVLQVGFTQKVGVINITNNLGGYCEIGRDSANGAYNCLSLDTNLADINKLHAEYYMLNGDSNTLFGFITNYGSLNAKATVQSLLNSTTATVGVVTKPAGALDVGIAIDTRYSSAKIYIKNLWYE